MKEIIINVDAYNENSIRTVEGDNLSEVYKIYILKNKRRIDLTNKIAVMAYVDEYGSKRSNILNLNITNAAEGEIELPITNIISEHNGVYACQVAIYGENNSLEQTAPFSLIVENNIFSKISNSAINSTDFHILSEAIKTTNAYASKLKLNTDDLELQYANRLNSKMDRNAILSMANIGQDVKEAMTGGSVAVVGKNAVSTINLTDGAVNEYKTNFLENTKNLFNTRTVSTKGYWKSIATGNSETNEYTTDLCYSDFIPVSSSTYYVSTPSITHSYCQYDSNKAFIKGDRYSSAFETAENAAYIVLNVNFDSASKIQLESGKINTEFEDYMLDFPLLKTDIVLKDYIKTNEDRVNVLDKSYFALNNTFNFDSKSKIINYPDTTGVYAYTTSTFSGWGTEIGKHKNIKSISFKIKSRSNPITKVKIRLTYDNFEGELIHEELRTVNINGEENIKIDFNSPIKNTENKIIFLSYLCNDLTDLYCSESQFIEKPDNVYWINGSLDLSSKQLNAGGTSSIQVKIEKDDSSYDLEKGLVNYSDVLKREALENSFNLVDRFKVTNTTGKDEFENYATSTFSGWGSFLGNYSNIEALKFKVKNRDTIKSTKNIKCWITEFNKDGEILFTKDLNVNIKPNETKDIIIKFDEPFNKEGKKLFLCYATDTLTTLIATNTDEAYNDTTIGWMTYTTNTNISSVTPKSFSKVSGSTGDTKAIKIDLGITEQLLNPTKDFIESLPKSDDKNIIENLRVILPNTITAVVGDTLQLFYRGMVEAVNPYNYDIRVRCQKGKAFTRYFEFTPNAGDVGEYDFSVEVYNNAKELLGNAKCKLKVVNTTGTVSTEKNILCVGDSLTAGGVWCKEAMRRLVESGGDPVGLNKSNINFIGTQKNGNCSFEGYGGWIWGSYLIEPNVTKEDIWVYCTHNKNSGDQHSIWQDAKGAKWKLETIESNRLKFTRYNQQTSPIPTAPGVLTHVENAINTESISFSKCTVADANPFWSFNTNRVDFKEYCKTHNFNGIDYVYTLLTWNGSRVDMATIEDNKNVIAQAKQFIDALHRDYPNAKVRIMGIQLPSLNGGTGANYGANGGYADTYGLVRGVFGLNLAYQEFANREEYKDFVEFVNVSTQFDSENNMPSTKVYVNTRSKKTEDRGTNGVHPTEEGYMQIADVAYRQLVRDLLQNQ